MKKLMQWLISVNKNMKKLVLILSLISITTQVSAMVSQEEQDKICKANQKILAARTTRIEKIQNQTSKALVNNCVMAFAIVTTMGIYYNNYYSQDK